MRAPFLALLLLVPTGACRATSPAASLRDARWIDLTHAFDERTIYWPNNPFGFELEVQSRGPTPGGWFYASNALRAPEHGGTHLDAPVHFAQGRWTVDQIPLDRLIGNALVVNVSGAAAGNPDYQVTVADLETWESANGAIDAGSIVLIRTDFSNRWPDAGSYLGTTERGDAAVAKLHFPGLHPDAAKWLAETRQVKAVGLDTASIDYGQSTLFETHRTLYERNIPAFENLTNLDQLPARGATLVALPMKIKGGSGAPLRAIAVL